MSLIDDAGGARALTGAERDRGGEGGGFEPSGSARLPLTLSNLETAVLDACAGESEWPARIAAGVYAGVDFAIAHPEVVDAIGLESALDADSVQRYERVVGRFAGFIQVRAPVGTRLPASTDEALVAGVVGMVGDHIRIGRIDRLEELRPELVLMILLPYLGFAEAQRWANEVAGLRADDR